MGQRKGFFRRKRISYLGDLMTSLRIEQGLTQQDVADSMRRSKSYICKIETSRGVPDPGILAGFARACGTRPEYLVGKAHQLELNLLAAITAPADLPTDPLKDVTEEERQELIRYLAFLRLSRHTAFSVA